MTECFILIAGRLGYLTETSCDGTMIGRNQFDLQYTEDGVELTVYCVFCGREQPKFYVSLSAWENYASGAMCVRDAFPELGTDERELLVSATCSKCWDEIT
jgi:hypothetical protein